VTALQAVDKQCQLADQLTQSSNNSICLGLQLLDGARPPLVLNCTNTAELHTPNCRIPAPPIPHLATLQPPQMLPLPPTSCSSLSPAID
jgi:hypothetical protein